MVGKTLDKTQNNIGDGALSDIFKRTQQSIIKRKKIELVIFNKISYLVSRFQKFFCCLILKSKSK